MSAPGTLQGDGTTMAGGTRKWVLVTGGAGFFPVVSVFSPTGDFGGAQHFEGRLAEQWLAAENEQDFTRRVEAIGADIEHSSALGKEQEQLPVRPRGRLRQERALELLHAPAVVICDVDVAFLVSRDAVCPVQLARFVSDRRGPKLEQSPTWIKTRQ